ncbi:BTAD domain-containing putative transcriptional regulator [Micromonospora costi]|uniref:AfsR/SARP family transcriptional regulator n=1 Tax=Micromonospora costi TaxID=1530042 RepID=UPI0033CD55C6
MRGAAGPVAMPGARQRVALATLLLRANHVVPLDDMVDNLWPDRPPATARDQVVNVMSGLRRLLATAGGAAGRASLVTQPIGYLLRVDADELDVERCQAFTREADAHAAAGRLPQAVTALRTALSLYRGPVLVDVPGRFAASEARRLEELRLALVEKLMEAEFALGRHRDVVPYLARLVEEHPLRERLRGQLMVALHAVGRTADALEVYRAGHRLMVRELGLDPSAELRRLEQAIRVDAEAAGTRPGEPPTPVGVPAPLPPDVTDFTGRADEVATTRRWLHGGSAGTALPIVVVTGPAGIGKTALASRVAHLVRADFPDGQLHVTSGGADTAAVLARMLTALALPPEAIPDDLDARVRLYRSVTASRRLLIVLDGVAEAAHVRPLLPGGAGCAVLVTSRRHLAGLDGARRIRLDALSVTDALALLGTTAGPERVAADPEVARRIVDLCGRLPLAVRAAGARAASSGWPGLREFADRLADTELRLDELRAGPIDVRAAIESELAELPPPVERAARRLAALDPSPLSLAAVAATLGVSREDAEDLTDHLVEWGVLEYVASRSPAPPRYRFPELVRWCLRGQSRPGGDAEAAGRVPSSHAAGA